MPRTTEQFEECNEDDLPVTEVNSISELLDSLEINEIPQYIKGKYVVIGNFKDDDKHDTYVGNKQGAELVFNAVMNLNNQKHIVNWLFAFILFVFYFGVIYLISSNKSLKDNLPFIRRSKSKILHFVFSFLEYTFFFVVFDIALFLFFDIAYSFILQLFILSSYKSYIENKQ